MTRMVFRSACYFALAMLFVSINGCAYVLFKIAESHINEAFPPVSFAQIKQEAVANAADGLRSVRQPTLLLNVPTGTIRESLRASIREVQIPNFRLLAANVVPDEQGLRVAADIEYSLEKPRGKITAKLTGWAAVSMNGQTASIRPALYNLVVTDVNMESWGFGNLLAKAVIDDVVRGLRGYMDNINGTVKPVEYMIDPTQIGLAGQQTIVDLGGGVRVTVPGVRLGSVAALIDVDGLHMVGDLGIFSPPKRTQSPSITYETYRSDFWISAKQVRPNDSLLGAGLFISDEFLTRLLAPIFPPVTKSILQERALGSLVDSLKGNDPIIAGAVIGQFHLERLAKDALRTAFQNIKDATFGEPLISFGDQILTVTAPVAYASNEGRLGIKGQVSLSGVIAPDKGKLFIRLLIADATIKEVWHLGGNITLTPFVHSVNSLILQLLPYLNGVLVPQEITIAAPIPNNIPMPTSKGVVVTPATLASIRLGVLRLMPRLTSSGLSVLVAESSTSSTDNVSGVRSNDDVTLMDASRIAASKALTRRAAIGQRVASATSAQADAAMKTRWENSLGSMPDIDAKMLSATGSLSWAVGVVDRTFKVNKVAANLVLDAAPGINESGDIKLGGGVGVQCAAPRDCVRQSCPLRGCSRDSCNWDCQRCGFWGCASDPFCEAGKAACNLREEASLGACNLQANADKALCDTREETALGLCNVERGIMIEACNLAKDTVDLINDLRSIGSMTVEHQIRGSAYLDEFSFSYDSAAQRLGIGARASATVDAQGAIDFVPADIGHLLVCPIRGKVPFHATGTVPAQSIFADVSLFGSESADGTLQIIGGMSSMEIKGNVSPAPADAIFVQNPQIHLTCSPVLTNPVAITYILGKVSAYTPFDVIGVIEKAIPGNQDSAREAIRMFTAGQVAHRINFDPLQFTIPPLSVQLASEVIKLKGTLRNGHIQFAIF